MTIAERTSLILVDNLESFSKSLSDSEKTYEIEDYGKGLVLTMWPFKRVSLREDPLLGKNIVALYEEHHDGFGQIIQWNYIEKAKERK